MRKSTYSQIIHYAKGNFGKSNDIADLKFILAKRNDLQPINVEKYNIIISLIECMFEIDIFPNDAKSIQLLFSDMDRNSKYIQQGTITHDGIIRSLLTAIAMSPMQDNDGNQLYTYDKIDEGLYNLFNK